MDEILNLIKSFYEGVHTYSSIDSLIVKVPLPYQHERKKHHAALLSNDQNSPTLRAPHAGNYTPVHRFWKKIILYSFVKWKDNRAKYCVLCVYNYCIKCIFGKKNKVKKCNIGNFSYTYVLEVCGRLKILELMNNLMKLE